MCPIEKVLTFAEVCFYLFLSGCRAVSLDQEVFEALMLVKVLFYVNNDYSNVNGGYLGLLTFLFCLLIILWLAYQLLKRRCLLFCHRN